MNYKGKKKEGKGKRERMKKKSQSIVRCHRVSNASRFWLCKNLKYAF